MGREQAAKRKAAESPECNHANKVSRQSGGEHSTTDGLEQVSDDQAPRAKQTLSVYACGGENAEKTLQDVYFMHLLVDGPEHMLFTAHFEEAISLFKARNPSGDALQDLIGALSGKAAAIGWNAIRTNISIDRVRKYALTYQIKYFADKIKISSDLKTIIHAVIALVPGQPDDVFDDPESVHYVRNKVNAALIDETSDAQGDAASASFEVARQIDMTENTQAQTAKTLTKKKMKTAKQQGAPDQSMETLDKQFMKAVNRLEHCVRALRAHSKYKSKTAGKIQEVNAHLQQVNRSVRGLCNGKHS